ncbi:MAG: UDP-N-acetylmuramoyl-tripeptide--D-alanyl-D-alanine ligase [Oscillospiraceae bacterium]|nr:UDP-N-acetylmuramoyl-tripeptide--D-alanyl-D-alanine ligase [Oscillospiraceae bacterium]
MKTITAGELAALVHGELVSGASETPVSILCVDSNQAVEGSVFLALRGGHKYIDDALDHGACGCVFSQPPQTLRNGKYYIRVANTDVAYKDIAAWHRSHFDIPVIQVTGSVGKTTTKDMIGSVLSARFETLRTEKNYNNEIGTPKTLMRLEKKHEAAVIETGMDGEGQIRYLGEMVKPSVAVITNIGDMHIERLGSRENILKAKCEIFENLAPDGFAVLNGDDELLNTVMVPQRVIRVGKGENCDVRFSDIVDKGKDGIICTVVTSRARYEMEIPTPGVYMAYPAAMAAAIGEQLGMTAEEIVRGAADYEPTDSRMLVHELENDRRLLDDCYNAGPQSMRAALDVLVGLGERTVAMLGDMAELGDLTEKAHREVGEHAKKLGVDCVITVGAKAKGIAAAYGHGAMSFDSVEDALDTVKKEFAPGTALLVKASHSMNFERIIKELIK